MSGMAERALAARRILTSGDSAVTVEFGNAIDPEINDQVYAFADTLTATEPEWLVDTVPTYRSVLIQYDPLLVSQQDVVDALGEVADRLIDAQTGEISRTPKIYELPVAYGGENGPDLSSVAENAGMPVDDVIRIHSSTAYRVYMLGFSPGFPYLGGMDERIACPRLKTPRTRVPAGSVGIAESQTGVYPSASPGGWQLIGRTPVELFDAAKDPPSVLQPGHFVRFVPVSDEELARIESDIASGSFRITVKESEH